MIVRPLVKKGTYFDSVTLMLISTEVKKLEGIENAIVGMGTDYNIQSLERLEMTFPGSGTLSVNDLVICVKAQNEQTARQGIHLAEKLLVEKKTRAGDGPVASDPTTQEGGSKLLPDANVVMISIPGNFAARETEIALNGGRHVMLFSDNVSVEEEVNLKELALNKGLLVMGPDCGTAIINSVPLAFANVVRKGDIGLVAASGTGLQEVTSIIHELGYGISQAIGVGGRDLSEKVAGRMTIQSALALAEDEKTNVMVLISKPPASQTLEKLYFQLKQIRKPIVIYFIGADSKTIRKEGFVAAENLEDAAIKACELSGKTSIPPLLDEKSILKIARKVSLPGKYLRGLYSGGTLCDEAQRLLQSDLDDIFSNTPVKGCKPLQNVYKSEKHTIIDLGDDEFTRGRAHPMIDPALRKERIEAECSDPDVGIIIFDVVLGFGSHHDMASEMARAVLKSARKSKKPPIFAATICGTQDDPQDYRKQRRILEEASVKVFPSNVSLIKFVKKCFKKD